MSRKRLTRFFLWISVLSLGIGVGAKLYDLIVLAGAWGASPPGSLALLPYGPHWPRDPGDFFQPASVPILVGMLGALICGWKTPLRYSLWLWTPVAVFVILWIFTIRVFWPMNVELYAISTGKLLKSDAEVIALVQKWKAYDWVRVAGMAVAFISSVHAISLPYPAIE